MPWRQRKPKKTKVLATPLGEYREYAKKCFKWANSNSRKAVGFRVFMATFALVGLDAPAETAMRLFYLAAVALLMSPEPAYASEEDEDLKAWWRWLLQQGTKPRPIYTLAKTALRHWEITGRQHALPNAA